MLKTGADTDNVKDGDFIRSNCL